MVSYIAGESKRTDITDLYSFARLLRIKFNGNFLGTPWWTEKKKLKVFLKQNVFDIVHVQTPYSPIFTGWVICNLPEKTKVLASLQIMPRTQMVSFGVWALKLLSFKSFKKIDLFVANNPAVADYFEKVWRLPKTPVIATAVDLSGFPAKKRPYHVKNKINVLFLGRLVERKGCLDLLEAVDLLPAALLSKIHLHIVGKGALEAKVKHKISESPLAEEITFHGFIDEKDKVAFLASGDLLVFPSRGGESFGISVLEGLASGFGIVLAAHNFGYDNLLGRRPALMFKADNPSALAACLKHWLEKDQSEYDEIMKWQKENLSGYDLEDVVGPQTLEAYQRLVMI